MAGRKPANRRKKTSKSRQTGLGKVMKSPAAAVASLAVAGASLAVAVTGPAPDLFKSETKPASLTMEPINKRGVTEYVLPLDARFEEMPAGVNGYCSEPVIEWLRKTGKEVPPYQRVSLRNTAQDGAMLAVSNVRAADLRKYDPQPVIRFVCPDGGNADTAVLHLKLDQDPQAQQVDNDSHGTKPFAFNLAPGEQGNIELHLLGDLGHSYSGRIVADVATGAQVETVSLPLNGNRDGFDRVSAGKFARLAVSPSMRPGSFSCSTSPPGTVIDESSSNSGLSECSPGDIRALVAEIAKTP
ncbi:hypothetical protein CFP71_02340 [Amycolatopsis thailandensis]|uniref:Secreted protein n=1 Tax=Amycolatopsis thailandensis TaxID=589330 RepID=A0A229SI48_9PSEU|nr:hypothetical protein [Amycolatopsis thailandensis]OXM58532.1 hypothetical protein CFP71_02340 [Amycolatopsis thailandensis]